MIPKTLKEYVICLVHEGHEGVVHTKQHLWSKVWWTGMNNMVELFTQKCHPPQVASTLTKSIPISTTSVPRSSLIMLGCDLCGTFPTGEHLLVYVDYYSRFPNVEIADNIIALSVISNFCQMFCGDGAPEISVTDNNSEFISTEMKTILKEFNTVESPLTIQLPLVR